MLLAVEGTYQNRRATQGGRRPAGIDTWSLASRLSAKHMYPRSLEKRNRNRIHTGKRRSISSRILSTAL